MTSHNLALCAALWGAFLAGLATTLLYVIRRRRVIVVPPFRPEIPPPPAVFRSELPTLTDIRVTRNVSELARRCRKEETTP